MPPLVGLGSAVKAAADRLEQNIALASSVQSFPVPPHSSL